MNANNQFGVVLRAFIGFSRFDAGEGEDSECWSCAFIQGDCLSHGALGFHSMMPFGNSGSTGPEGTYENSPAFQRLLSLGITQNACV
jgi:hypothetical protein